MVLIRPAFPYKMQTKKRNAKINIKKEKNHARVSSKHRNTLKKKFENTVVKDTKPKDSKTLLIAQEVKFARLLANNDKKVRDKVLKNLKKWLMVRSQSTFAFTEADFMRLWKGLFYCMWMSDKPLVQEELADSLSKMVHCFESADNALLYTKCTLKSLAIEWFGIDRYRIDKFEMLVRKIIRQTFEMCKKQFWNKQWVVGVGNVIEDILLDLKACIGFNLHVTEVYMEELAKISEGLIPKSIVTEFIRPFVIYLVVMNDQRQMKHVIKNIFRYLIFQSDVGMDYSEKFCAWREAGFPCKNINEMQRVEVSDDENEDDKSTIEQIKNKPLDPRAGRVDVEIPQIPFDSVEIVNLLKENKFHESSTTKTRKLISRLINDFTKLSKDEMPFGIKEIPIQETTRINPYEAANELLNFDNKLYADSSKNNRKRKKNRDILESDENNDNNEKGILSGENVKKKGLTKKLKLSKNAISEKLNNKLKNKKIKKQNDKIGLTVKKTSKNFNLSELNPSKKLAAKKEVNTFAECTANFRNTDVDISKNSTTCNWKVDTPSKELLILNKSTHMKILEHKKKPKKCKVILQKQEDKNLLKSNVSWLTPVLTRLEEENKITFKKATVKRSPETDSTKKRVKIMLQRNTAQNTSEYIRQLRQSPAIPFDANKKPKAGVLKPSPFPNPMNPFYRRKLL